MGKHFFFVISSTFLFLIILLEHTTNTTSIFFFVTWLCFILHLSLFTDVDMKTLVHVSCKAHDEEIIIWGYSWKDYWCELIVFFWLFLLLAHFCKLKSLIYWHISFLLIIIFSIISLSCDGFDLTLMLDLEKFFRVVFKLIHDLVVQLHFWPYFNTDTHDFDLLFI